MSKHYSIVIDTENYAGNFERRMCAFLTGQIGDGYVGDGADIVEKYSADIKHLDWWNNHIIKKQPVGNYHGKSPVHTAITPGWWNNGRGLHYRDGERLKSEKCPAYLSLEIYVSEIPSDDVIEELVERAKYFSKNLSEMKVTLFEKRKPLKLTGVRIINNKSIADELSSVKF